MLLLDIYIYTSIDTDECRHKQGVLIIPSHKSELKQAQRTTTPNPNYEEKILNFLIFVLQQDTKLRYFLQSQ